MVRTSQAVASTPARSAKVASLAALLRRLEGPGEAEAAVAFLTGRPRQGRIGVGWATLRAVDPPAAGRPSLRVLDLDAAVAALGACAGPGSAAARHAVLVDLLGGPPLPRPTSSAASCWATCARARSTASWPTPWPGRRPSPRRWCAGR